MGKIGINELEKIRNLVGDITEENLRNVDCYVSEHIGIFIPSVGYCDYAITPRHTHPAYSFVIFFSENQPLVKPKIELTENDYLMVAMSPDIPHEEKEEEVFTRYAAILISKEIYDKKE